jgi:hypothetical protein
MIESSKFKVPACRQARQSSKLLLLIFLILLCFFLYISLGRSLFFQKGDRVNLIVYGAEPAVYSLGLKDKVNYLIKFYPDLKVKVPGGYGYYRLGGLGKLVSLEKNPSLFKKTFSYVTSSFVNRYFYYPSEAIFYGKSQPDRKGARISLLSFIKQKSNGSFFDQLFFINFFLRNRLKDFIIINSFNDFVTKDGYFIAEDFFKEYQGYFYQPIFRQEKLNTQLIYKKDYQTAKMISNIIEGNGIRVVDISQKSQKGINGCLVVENRERFSQSAQALAGFFQCRLKKANPEISDIIMYIGKKEDEWEID